MKYEDQYEGNCWDFLFFPSCKRDESIIELLNNYYGAEIVDSEKFRYAFFALMEKFHEEGIIKPQEYMGPFPIEDLKRTVETSTAVEGVHVKL